MALILKLRMLTVQLVYAIKRWKEMVKRATATFTIGEALLGKEIGRYPTMQEKNERTQKILSLKPSSDMTQASMSTQDSQQFTSSGDKFRHQYKLEQLKKQSDEMNN